MKRVIFVDDETNILSGLKRMLRPMRKDWHMEFFDNGEDALASIAKEKCDVIVSDMRMPKMDGVELLTTVRKSSPATVRIALSGQSDSSMIYRCIKNAHQYLAKPCSADQLVDTVSRVGAIQEMITDQRLKSRLADMESVPSLPESYKRLMDELQVDEPSMKVVANIIETDVAIAAKVLQVVNSAYFGLPRHVSSPYQAVMFLGIDAIKNLVLAHGVFSQFDPALVKSLRLDKILSHSFRVGTLAKAIALDYGVDKITADNAMMGGLLGDIGTLIMATDRPADIVETNEAADLSNQMVWQVEVDRLGYSHMEVGAYLVSLWGLPNGIAEAIAYHHRPGECEGQEFSSLTAVHIANAFVSHKEIQGNPHLDMNYVNQLNLTDRLEHWASLSAEEKECEESN